MKFRLSFFVAALTAVQFAFGSYELMYVTDNSAAKRGVYRFDPISGAYLGSFGRGQLYNPISIAKGAGDVVYVLDMVYSGSSYGSYVRSFVGSTGQYLSSFNLAYGTTAQSRISVYGNEVYIGSSTTFSSGYGFKYDLTGSYFGYYGPTGTAVNGVVKQAGNVYTFGSNLISGFAPSSSAPFGSTASGAATNLQLQAMGSNYIVAPCSTGSVTVYYVNGSTIGGQAYGAVPNLASMAGLAIGHDTLSHGAGLSSTGSFRISNYDVRNLVSFDYFDYGSLLTNPTDCTIVVAPEPSTWIASALGLAILVRRRRKS